MKIATCLIVLLFGALLAPPAAAAPCDGVPATPAISVRVDAAPVVNDRSLSVAALTKMPTESRRAGMEAFRTFGLTETQSDSDADFKLLTLPDGQGGFCTTANTFNVVVHWRTTVHIAAQIKPGTCMDQVVGAHESKHVAIDAALLPVMRRAVELALTSVLRHGVAGSTVDGSRRNLQDQAKAAIGRAFDAFAIVRRRRQLALDNPDEYDKLGNSCGIMEYLHAIHESGDNAGS